GVVPLIPHLGHRALVMLAEWMAKGDEPEADTHPMDGSAGGSAPTPCGNDEQSHTTDYVDGSGDQS
ncbi:hypothetical protein, partial [Novosphingobium sp. Rr 2-17]|uniref:hypothetical protein n=1 Tax=Novosphingobium sp. Rr 2-17 TaxID=555793 RepID=UPI001ED95666